MHNNLKLALVAVVAAGAVVVSLSAAQASTGYTTTLKATDPATKVAYFYGTLSLDVASNGIVHGYYKAQYEDGFVPVQGSYRDGKYWLTIGDGLYQVYATKQADGSLAGSASQTALTPSRSGAQSFSTSAVAPMASGDLYPQTFTFVANPG